MSKLYEHRMLTKSGYEAYSDGWCEKHWLDVGQDIFDGDTGRKELRVHEMPEAKAQALCTGCKEETLKGGTT
jgi:hypothetical protein